MCSLQPWRALAHQEGKQWMITVSLSCFVHNCRAHHLYSCHNWANSESEPICATNLHWQHCRTITILSKFQMPYLHRFSRSSSGRRVMNMPCSAARRGYKRRITSLGVVPELYAFFISLKPNEKAVMMSLVLRAPFRKLCLPRPTACRMLSAILAVLTDALKLSGMLQTSNLLVREPAVPSETVLTMARAVHAT